MSERDTFRSKWRTEALAKVGRAITPLTAYTEREVLSGLSREFGFHHNDPMFALVTLIAAYDATRYALPFKPGDLARYTRPVTDLHNGWFNDREMLANEVGTIRSITFNGVHYIWQALVTYETAKAGVRSRLTADEHETFMTIAEREEGS